MSKLQRRIAPLIIGWGIGIFTAYLVGFWGEIPTILKIFYLCFFALILMDVRRLIFTSEGGYSNNKNNYASSSPAKTMSVESTPKPYNASDDSQPQPNPIYHNFLPIKFCIRVYRLLRSKSTITR